jgi:hypothetical protein
MRLQPESGHQQAGQCGIAAVIRAIQTSDLPVSEKPPSHPRQKALEGAANCMVQIHVVRFEQASLISPPSQSTPVLPVFFATTAG